VINNVGAIKVKPNLKSYFFLNSIYIGTSIDENKHITNNSKDPNVIKVTEIISKSDVGFKLLPS
jgi:hypothetical protein